MNKFLIVITEIQGGVTAYLMRNGEIEKGIEVKDDDMTKACEIASHYLLKYSNPFSSIICLATSST